MLVYQRVTQRYPKISTVFLQITGMEYIGIFITAFGIEQQTPSVAPIVETFLGEILSTGERRER